MTGARFRNGREVIGRWNRVFDAVSAEPRRQLIVSLVDAEPSETVPLPESAINPNVPVDPETLRVELRHNHLPRLAEEGFVEWGTDPLRASQGARFDEVAVVFETLHGASAELPDSLVIGCQRLERERQQRRGSK
jgi:hypothetical protein